MGGSNAELIAGLRLHIKDGNVHVHDDTKKLKFSLDQDDFSVEVELAFEELKDNDGIYEISGKGDNFCILKSGKVWSVFVKDRISIKQKLVSFLKD